MLHRIILHLARAPDHPDGSDRIGYELLAPLDGDGHLDPIGWQQVRALCHVRRFAPDEPERGGLLVHRPGGTGGATWLIDFGRGAAGDDESGHRLETHVFRKGECISIGNARRRLRTFRIVDVQPVRERLAPSRRPTGEAPGRRRVRVPW
ncbi:hypothetical protein [Labrys wisconsinensis]|uniref:Uncharacterized protein n=1 Tax=Labrys wisconsinensis TaxID=425677 RepID=A0ABU0J6D4_9HYPH|nr:hypothetical protein [Labrys wisconsinensis]MDQ0469827.1 hypothetical protein [Labrys wisconsinensis]